MKSAVGKTAVARVALAAMTAPVARRSVQLKR